MPLPPGMRQQQPTMTQQMTQPPTNQPTTLPTPVGPSSLDRLLRTALHGVVIIVLANALAELLSTRPLGRHILGLISPYHCVPWSISVSAGLNADRLAATILVVVLTVTTWPNDFIMPGLAVVAGLIIGRGIRQLLQGGLHG